MSLPLGILRRALLALLVAGGAGPLAGNAATSPARPAMPPISVEARGRHLPGKFVWADLVTDDLPAAQRFYSGLLGWRFQAVTQGYLVALHEERPLAGILYRPKPADRPARPAWFGYISVPDVGRAAGLATNAGARVVAPREKVPGRGEQAVFRDPEGALFGVIRAASGDTPDFQAQPGEWIWVQMMTRAGRGAAEFYSRVAGYRIVENTSAGRLSDHVLTSQGYARATVREIPEAAREVEPGWLLFVRVARLADAIARTRELGGSVLLEPRPEFLGGRVAVVADPTGAPVGLLEWSEALLSKGGGR